MARQPDLVIVDLSLGSEDGLELIELLKHAFPSMPTLVFSMHEERVADGGANALLVVDDYNFKLIQSLQAHAPLHAMQGGRAVELVDTVRARIKRRMAQSSY